MFRAVPISKKLGTIYKFINNWTQSAFLTSSPVDFYAHKIVRTFAFSFLKIYFEIKLRNFGNYQNS